MEKATAYAGTFNGNGSLKIEVKRVADATTLGNIIRLVEEAQSKKAPVQKLVDKISSVFVPVCITTNEGFLNLFFIQKPYAL